MIEITGRTSWRRSFSQFLIGKILCVAIKSWRREEVLMTKDVFIDYTYQITIEEIFQQEKQPERKDD